ncbi:hypothetical protein BKP45_04955 [Anaerobacillus alkalidiazotrophicus]|uniref:Pentapeptide repeat-containing protein n=1 Tax=Anaerobacillus alkalidiazotrophicus TaxID=472963 RepID=A0A1S2MBH9_9BACI|nr:pentapeptide repeat-containing protein [Anaerobacillus alkalidiazotrophicus]OIJ22029.1 hypothetical protein BKP45_04955 [Anaerobacillus alkalidiazotrophicus]
MGRNKLSKGKFNYINMDRRNRNYMYKNFYKSISHGTNFSGSNFNFASLRAAKFTVCSFYKANFYWTEFIGTNIKRSNFESAYFENVTFNSVSFERVNFENAIFKNVKFLNVGLKGVKNFRIEDHDITILNDMPNIVVNQTLNDLIDDLRKNDYIRRSKVLHLKKNRINTLNISILLEYFTDEELIIGLKLAGEKLNKNFSTVSYLIKFIQKEI